MEIRVETVRQLSKGGVYRFLDDMPANDEFERAMAGSDQVQLVLKDRRVVGTVVKTEAKEFDHGCQQMVMHVEHGEWE